MLKSFFLMMPILCSSYAHAGELNCAGDTMDYHFSVHANISGARVVGHINVVVTKSGRILRRAALPVVSSRISKRSLGFAAQDSVSRIAVSAAVTGLGIYKGTLAAKSTEGSTQMPAVCSLRQGRLTSPQ